MCTDDVDLKIDDETWEKQIHDEVTDLLTRIDVDALLQEVSRITGNNVICSFEPEKYLGAGAIMGCANYHGWIHFDDGKKWIVRIPRAEYSDVPETLIDYLVISEYATLKFLEDPKVPAPRAFAYGLASNPQNAVGVSYILMEALPGTPYYSSAATPEEKESIFSQLADILIEISKHPLLLAGSLIQSNGDIEVSFFASNRFIALHQYGPFDNALTYFVQTAEQYLDLIADSQLYHEYPIDAFKFYMILRGHAHVLTRHKHPGHFFLRHVDDKGDHLLVDEKGTITGIIDWQFARCVPASEAFGPSYFTADLNALYSGKMEITAEDKRLAVELRKKGAEALAQYLERDDFVRTFCHGLASGLSKDEVRYLITNVTAGLQTRGIWQQDIMAKCERDARWERVKVLDNIVESS